MTQPSAILLSLIIAFIPSAAFTLLVWWLDRYEREPVRLLAVSFLWGAVPAVALSILLEMALGTPVPGLQTALWHELGVDTLMAPVIEELAKGVAFLLLFILAADQFNDVLDGLVYGAVIGFGFAMTENALYFADVMARGETFRLSAIVLLRSLLFGLNHAFYTAIIGVSLGLAVQITGPYRGWRWLLPVLGVGLAIGFHAVHNLGMALASESRLALTIALLANWGGILLLLAIGLLAWREERDLFVEAR